MQDKNMAHKEDDNFNLKDQLSRYLVNYKWFVFSVVVSLFLAFIYLRYSTPEYKVSAVVLIKDDKKGGLASEYANFADLGVLGGGKSNLDNEIEILKSRTLIEKTVLDLELNVSYFNDGRVK